MPAEKPQDAARQFKPYFEAPEYFEKNSHSARKMYARYALRVQDDGSYLPAVAIIREHTMPLTILTLEQALNLANDLADLIQHANNNQEENQ